MIKAFHIQKLYLLLLASNTLCFNFTAGLSEYRRKKLSEKIYVGHFLIWALILLIFLWHASELSETLKSDEINIGEFVPWCINGSERRFKQLI